MMIDFHAHILPGLDHGCDTKEMMVEQLKLAKEAGITYIAATSHYYPHSETVEAFLERRQKVGQEIADIRQTELPVVMLGAEVLICEGMERMEGIDKLIIGDSGVILLEMPFCEWEQELLDTLEAIRDLFEGKVVLAHIERYGRKNIAKILGKGYLLQVNSSFVKSMSKRRLISQLLKDERIVALGSDIHGLGSNYKDYQKANQYLLKKQCNCTKESQILLGLDI